MSNASNNTASTDGNLLGAAMLGFAGAAILTAMVLLAGHGLLLALFTFWLAASALLVAAVAARPVAARSARLLAALAPRGLTA